MVGPRPKAPGWYPDPDILPGSKGVLRYWNGHHWTDRRRPVPVLARFNLATTIGAPPPRALEGPARAAELPAAAEVSAGREGPGGRADTLDRPVTAEVRSVELPTATGGARGVPPRPPGSDDGGHGPGGGGEGGDGRPRATSRPRWWLLAAFGIAGALAVVMGGEALQPPSPGPRVVTDATFVKAANTLCAKTLPGLRPADGGAFGSVVSATQVASDIDEAATGLDNLAERLGVLPDTATDKPFVRTWLQEWHTYAALGRQYAQVLREKGTTKKVPPVLASAARVAEQASNFAVANHMIACQFTYVDTSGASDM